MVGLGWGKGQICLSPPQLPPPQKWGEEKVQIWRRSYNSGPPGGESLKDTSDRVLPYYLDEIHPLILSGKNILIAAHGNSLRSLVKHLDIISEKEIVELEIPTGAPIHYLFDKNGEVIKKKNLINTFLTG